MSRTPNTSRVSWQWYLHDGFSVCVSRRSSYLCMHRVAVCCSALQCINVHVALVFLSIYVCMEYFCGIGFLFASIYSFCVVATVSAQRTLRVRVAQVILSTYAPCCSVLQCVAVCCSVLQCVAVHVAQVCPSIFVRVGSCYSCLVFPCLDTYLFCVMAMVSARWMLCNVWRLQCVAACLVCCGILQCVAVPTRR